MTTAPFVLPETFTLDLPIGEWTVAEAEFVEHVTGKPYLQLRVEFAAYHVDADTHVAIAAIQTNRAQGLAVSELRRTFDAIKAADYPMSAFVLGTVDRDDDDPKGGPGNADAEYSGPE